MICLCVKYCCLDHYIRSENGLIEERINWRDSSWLWFMIVVAVLMTARCKIKEQKLKDFYLIFCPWSDTEQNQERGGSPESNVDQEVHRAWLEHIAESGWILSNMSQEKVEGERRREILSESQCSDSDHDLSSVSLPPHFQSRVKSRIVHSNFKRMQFDFDCKVSTDRFITCMLTLQMQKCYRT